MLSASLPCRLASLVLKDAAPLRRRDAHNEIDVVHERNFAPLLLQVAVVLWGHGQARAVVDAVVIEEHAKDLMPLGERRLHELQGAVGRLVRVGSLIDDDSQLQTALLRRGSAPFL